MQKINASIVLYYNSKEQLLKAIHSFLNTELSVRLYLVDNSYNDESTVLSNIDERIVYIFNNANLGYGKAHNVAIQKSIEDGVPYHLVLNPDVYFDTGVLETIYDFMESNKDVAHVMPKVLYPNGELQYLCKLLPTPFDLFGRRFLNFGPFKKIVEKRNELYELRFTGYDKVMEVPYLSGCFMFLRTKALQEVGLFDERFFMYPEDIDLTRRLTRKYKTVYYPHVVIYHDHAKESYKNIKMLLFHIRNIAKYFNKWGWFFDKDKQNINSSILRKLK